MRKRSTPTPTPIQVARLVGVSEELGDIVDPEDDDAVMRREGWVGHDEDGRPCAEQEATSTGVKYASTRAGEATTALNVETTVARGSEDCTVSTAMLIVKVESCCRSLRCIHVVPREPNKAVHMDVLRVFWTG
jgi:hypothetical protein